MVIQIKQKSAFFAEEKHSKIFKALNPEKLGLLFDCEFVCLQAWLLSPVLYLPVAATIY